MLRSKSNVTLVFVIFAIGSSIVAGQQPDMQPVGGNAAKEKNQNSDATVQLKTGTEPSWSPDSKRIAFSSGKFPEGREIYVMDAGGSNIKQLTRNTFADEYPMWSPRGEKILFSTNREGTWKLYVMNLDGSNPKSLGIETSNDPNDPCRAAWSSDGSKILFPVTREGKREVFVANVDGTNMVRLITMNANYPQWSPNGKTIAFFNGDERNIYLINADGTSPRKLTEKNDRPAMSNYPSWSHDGSRIFFIEQNDRQGDIFSIRIDGSDRKKITNTPGRKFYAIASPDGSRVIYMTYDSAKPDALHIVKADGSGEATVLGG